MNYINSLRNYVENTIGWMAVNTVVFIGYSALRMYSIPKTSNSVFEAPIEWTPEKVSPFAVFLKNTANKFHESFESNKLRDRYIKVLKDSYDEDLSN